MQLCNWCTPGLGSPSSLQASLCTTLTTTPILMLPAHPFSQNGHPSIVYALRVSRFASLLFRSVVQSRQDPTWPTRCTGCPQGGGLYTVSQGRHNVHHPTSAHLQRASVPQAVSTESMYAGPAPHPCLCPSSSPTRYCAVISPSRQDMAQHTCH